MELELGSSVLFDNTDLQYIGHNGELIRLERKERIVRNSLDYHNDESFGININQLLQNIENKEPTESASNGEFVSAKLDAKNELWVEKWKPRTFLDLVGNEATNRKILGWLRQWSPVVFGDNTLPETQDPLNRPFKKILLIHGPPGIGKTSLSHIIAKQQGYHVSEINASDERSGSNLNEKIKNNLFSNTFNSKPTCLILDEVDGSLENGMVRFLLNIIKNDINATNNLHNKSKTRKNLLLRPIICICNNLYASSLEKLRPQCEIIAFKKPNENTIIERLQHILSAEAANNPNLSNIETIFLKQLVLTAQNDLRNCINNLQFLTTPTSKPQEMSLSLSDKDGHSSWFKVTNEVFKKSLSMDNRQNFLDVLSKLEQFDDSFNKIIAGCFTIYPHMKYSDLRLIKPVTISEWLYFNDLIINSLFQTGRHDLMRYQVTIPMKFHVLFSDISNKKDQLIKNADFEVMDSIKNLNNIMKDYLSRVSMTNSSSLTFVNKKTLLLQLLPYLDEILATEVNNMKNLKTKNQIIKTMIEVLQMNNLKLIEANTSHFIIDKDSTDNYGKNILSIDPPISKIVILEDRKVRDLINKRPNNMKLLQTKIEENKVKKRHLEQSTEKNLQSENNKKLRKNGSSTIDFFKKQYNSIKQNNETNNGPGMSDKQASELNSGSKHRIWVKYKEGFSNAVRKNVSWETLWQ